MSEIPRRALLGGALVAAASTMVTSTADAQYVWQKSAWPAADLDTLARVQRRIKQVVHAHDINGGRFLNNTKNALNGLLLGTGIAANQIQIVCALNGPANMLNYSDYVWQKYRIGQWAKVNDPKTGEPALRNIFYPSRAGAEMKYASTDPSSPDSSYQDATVQGLQARGVRFLSCHTSTEETARALVRQNNLSGDPEEVVKDMQAHTIPNVLIVPSIAGALAVLQCDGRYSYMAV